MHMVNWNIVITSNVLHKIIIYHFVFSSLFLKPNKLGQKFIAVAKSNTERLEIAEFSTFFSLPLFPQF